MYWYEKEAKQFSCVLSTRVRFARNLEDTPFPHRLLPEEAEGVFARVKDALKEEKIMAVLFENLEHTVKQAYVQTHLASEALLCGRAGSGLILSEDGDVSIMINEEDHVRLQVFSPGSAVQESFDKAVAWCKKLEDKLPFAYRETLGYLTSCPSNLGAAMRISVMIHLPAMTMGGVMGSLTKSLNNAGFTVRGMFGEGSRESGAIYQISNQMSGAKDPKRILREFLQMLAQVEENEKKAREGLITADEMGMTDRVYRALGTLKYARKMSYGEFISLYSTLRFGMEAGIVEEKKGFALDRLFTELMPAPMMLRDATLQEDGARDERRAALLREALKEI